MGYLPILVMRCSPPARLLAGLSVGASVALAPAGLVPLAKATMVAAASAALTACPLSRVLRRVSLAGPAILMALLPLLIQERTLSTVLVAGRCFCAIFVLLAFASTVPQEEAPNALRALGLPRILASILSATLQQARTLQQEGQRLALARRLRGGSGLRPTAEVFASLLARTASQAERSELAMRLRGQDAAHLPPAMRLSRKDLPLIVGIAGITLLLHASP